VGGVSIFAWMALQAAASPPTLSQVLALPLADRVSLVIELTDAVPHASLTASPDHTSATIETGPVGTVAPLDLESGQDAKCIDGVAIRGYQLSAGTFMHVIVRLRSPCQQKLRVAGRRIYLDLSPQESAVASGPAASPSPAGLPLTKNPQQPLPAATVSPSRSQTAVPPAVSSKSQAAAPPPANQPRSQQQPSASGVAASGSLVHAPTTSSPPASPTRAGSSNQTSAAAPEDPTEKAYRALEADALKRAKTYAAQGNVKAMQSLRDEVIRRDVQFGRKRPEIMTNLLNDLDRYADEARAMRLKLDALLFRKSQPG